VNFQFKKRLIIITLFQAAIIIFSFIFYHKLSLLSYINIAFYISFSLLILFLAIFTTQAGFYDVIGKSFNYAFSRDITKQKRKFTDIPSLSEMITLNKRPFLFYGLINGLFMLIALLVYYLR